jgi:hypothetical protein
LKSKKLKDCVEPEEKEGKVEKEKRGRREREATPELRMETQRTERER